MIELLPRQTLAFDVLTEPEYNDIWELLYGGGAGGGKSMLGCVYLSNQSLLYPGTRWLMGRNTLKTLKETTLKSFFEVAKMGGIRHNYVENKGIKFPNGSEIILKDLAFYPSDPDFSELGSLEITGAFIDECDQITEKAWNIVKSRIRYKLDDYKLTPKMLGTCNPSRNWVFSRFYEPYKEGKLPADRMFIQSLLTDNKKISKYYEKNLNSLDEISRERLKKGNWDYINITNLWSYSFRREKHVGKVELNPNETVYLGFDFNRNPMACVIMQHYDNHLHVLEAISIDNCTTVRMCDEIEKRYPNCHFRVTGDVSGKAGTTISILNNFDIIKQRLGLGRAQMDYSGANPALDASRQLINVILEMYPTTIDYDKCQSLIYDLENVKSDIEGKPIKANRTDPAQRADNLDAFRYIIHRYFKEFKNLLT